jgi:hypothetical protein
MSTENPIQLRDVAPAFEFMSWVAVLLIPFLRLVNGPAVTDDQFCIQCILVSMVLGGALSLRLYNRRR